MTPGGPWTPFNQNHKVNMAYEGVRLHSSSEKSVARISLQLVQVS